MISIKANSFNVDEQLYPKLFEIPKDFLGVFVYLAPGDEANFKLFIQMVKITHTFRMKH